MCRGSILAVLFWAVLAAAWMAQAPAVPPKPTPPEDPEQRHYALEFLTPPQDEVIEVGGMDFLSDGRLVVSTRRGRVWILDDPTAADPKDVEFTMFADGLHEGLGLKVVDDVIYVLQRGELSRLIDRDGDGRAERVEAVSLDWGMSGNYHEFSFGLPRNAEGRFYVSLNLGFWSPKWWHGKAKARGRGWVFEILPDGTAFRARRCSIGTPACLRAACIGNRLGNVGVCSVGNRCVRARRLYRAL